MFRIILILILLLACATQADPAKPRSTQDNFYSARSVVSLSGFSDGNIGEYLKTHDAVVVKRGNGGLIKGMLDTLAFLHNHPKKVVVIDGPCFSACTMLITSPNTLITRNAELYFHSAVRNSCVNGKWQTALNPDANTLMMSLFSEPVRNWILSSGAYSSTKFTMLPIHTLRRELRGRFLATSYIPEFNKQTTFAPNQPTNLGLIGCTFGQ